MFGYFVGDLFCVCLDKIIKHPFVFLTSHDLPITSSGIWRGCLFPTGEQNGLVVSVQPASKYQGSPFNFFFLFLVQCKGRNVIYFHSVWKPQVWISLSMLFSLLFIFSLKQLWLCLYRSTDHFDHEASQRVGDTLAQGLSTENANSSNWAILIINWHFSSVILSFCLSHWAGVRVDWQV